MNESKVVLVTGATRGLGEAIASEMVARGHRVYGGGRSFKGGEERPFTPMSLDITDAGSVKTAVDGIVSEQGRVDILVNNAGISHCGSIEETPVEYGRSVFDTNYFGMLRMVRAVLPSMRARKSGTIVNIGSAAGKIGIPFQAHYSSSKFAVEGVSESLKYELAPFGIRVILIEPGDVETGIWERTKTPVPEGSPYTEAMSRFLKVKEKEMGGKAPRADQVAKRIADIVHSDTKKLRHPVAGMAGLFMTLRKILPDEAFMWAVARNYGQRE